ncbi:uncharacterized protein CEXT_557521 [Caerostris extrusa]|uniref:Apple domain-containing protein n=1 Tax=Caerostris extrusa TaxID=172846 RepID=A0AAV4RAE1_CAEEX|nr:uncharacterized protein CEXT_557521 [Caerostris extrusa]
MHSEGTEFGDGNTCYLLAPFANTACDFDSHPLPPTSQFTAFFPLLRLLTPEWASKEKSKWRKESRDARAHLIQVQGQRHFNRQESDPIRFVKRERRAQKLLNVVPQLSDLRFKKIFFNLFLIRSSSFECTCRWVNSVQASVRQAYFHCNMSAMFALRLNQLNEIKLIDDQSILNQDSSHAGSQRGVTTSPPSPPCSEHGPLSPTHKGQRRLLFRRCRAFDGSCSSGFITFELITGYVYTSPGDTMELVPGTLQLTECLSLCSANATCQAINFETGLCVLFSSSANQRPASLTPSQFPVFTIYAHKVCLLEEMKIFLKLFYFLPEPFLPHPFKPQPFLPGHSCPDHSFTDHSCPDHSFTDHSYTAIHARAVHHGIFIPGQPQALQPRLDVRAGERLRTERRRSQLCHRHVVARGLHGAVPQRDPIPVSICQLQQDDWRVLPQRQGPTSLSLTATNRHFGPSSESVDYLESNCLDDIFKPISRFITNLEINFLKTRVVFTVEQKKFGNQITDQGKISVTDEKHSKRTISVTRPSHSWGNLPNSERTQNNVQLESHDSFIPVTLFFGVVLLILVDRVPQGRPCPK